jgi:hypothetical protein
MIGMIQPLVKEARYHREAARTVVVYAAGVLLSAVVAGAGWALLGVAIHRVMPVRIAILAVAAACAAFILLDLGVRGARPLTLRRQTCYLWWRGLGDRRAWFFWGIDLGLGVTTYRATSLYWAAVLTAVLVAPPAAIPLVMVAYGAGLVANLALGSVALWRTGLFGHGGKSSLLFMRPVRTASAVVLAVWSAALLWVALT